MDGYLITFCIFAAGILAASIWVRLRYPIVAPRRQRVPVLFPVTHRDCTADCRQTVAEPESSADRRAA